MTTAMTPHRPTAIPDQDEPELGHLIHAVGATQILTGCSRTVSRAALPRSVGSVCPECLTARQRDPWGPQLLIPRAA